MNALTQPSATPFVKRNTIMANLISIEDLNTTVNHEPRILDVTLAERLGFARVRKIKELIERNASELEAYSDLTVENQTLPHGGAAKSYYLSEGQALVLCALSRTEKAAEVRKALIEVFMAYRRGELVPATITPAQQSKLQQIVRERVEEAGSPHVYFWSRFNNHFKLGSYKQLPYHCFDDAVIYLMKMPAKVQPKAIPKRWVENQEWLEAQLKALDSSVNQAKSWSHQVDEILGVFDKRTLGSTRCDIVKFCMESMQEQHRNAQQISFAIQHWQAAQARTMHAQH